MIDHVFLASVLSVTEEQLESMSVTSFIASEANYRRVTATLKQ